MREARTSMAFNLASMVLPNSSRRPWSYGGISTRYGLRVQVNYLLRSRALLDKLDESAVRFSYVAADAIHAEVHAGLCRLKRMYEIQRMHYMTSSSDRPGERG